MIVYYRYTATKKDLDTVHSIQMEEIVELMQNCPKVMELVRLQKALAQNP